MLGMERDKEKEKEKEREKDKEREKEKEKKEDLALIRRVKSANDSPGQKEKERDTPPQDRPSPLHR